MSHPQPPDPVSPHAQPLSQPQSSVAHRNAATTLDDTSRADAVRGSDAIAPPFVTPRSCSSSRNPRAEFREGGRVRRGVGDDAGVASVWVRGVGARSRSKDVGWGVGVRGGES